MGPEFDAHRVDFAVLVQRNAMYRDAEKRSMDEYRQQLEAKKPEAKASSDRTGDGGLRTGGEVMTTEKTEEKVKTKSKNPVPNRERIKMPRLHMPEQAPSVRAHEFTEVNLGYSAELARQEAIRCLECAKPTC